MQFSQLGCYTSSGKQHNSNTPRNNILELRYIVCDNWKILLLLLTHKKRKYVTTARRIGHLSCLCLQNLCCPCPHLRSIRGALAEVGKIYSVSAAFMTVHPARPHRGPHTRGAPTNQKKIYIVQGSHRFRNMKFF